MTAQPLLQTTFDESFAETTLGDLRELEKRPGSTFSDDLKAVRLKGVKPWTS